MKRAARMNKEKSSDEDEKEEEEPKPVKFKIAKMSKEGKSKIEFN